MDEKPTIRLTKTSHVHTYCEMWDASESLLSKGRSDAEGSFYQFMGSLVFTAFSLEAYFNHIGPDVLESWKAMERRSPKNRLTALADELGIEIDFETRPWQIIEDLFGFRNKLAHGKTVKVQEDVVVPFEGYFRYFFEGFVETDWEKFCTQENAEWAREDVEQVIRTLHAVSDPGEDPFIGGMQETKANFEGE